MTGKKHFVTGLIIGAIFGGVLIMLALNSMNRKSVSNDNYEFLNLSHGEIHALRISKHTGESWGLTSDGGWLKLNVLPGVMSPDDWLKSQNYAPDSNGHWTLKTN